MQLEIPWDCSASFQRFAGCAGDYICIGDWLIMWMDNAISTSLLRGSNRPLVTMIADGDEFPHSVFHDRPDSCKLRLLQRDGSDTTWNQCGAVWDFSRWWHHFPELIDLMQTLDIRGTWSVRNRYRRLQQKNSADHTHTHTTHQRRLTHTNCAVCLSAVILLFFLYIFNVWIYIYVFHCLFAIHDL